MSLLWFSESLSREIERVTILRTRLQFNGTIPDQNPKKPAIELMNAAIEAGHQAIGSSDTQTIIHATRELRGFTE